MRWVQVGLGGVAVSLATLALIAARRVFFVAATWRQLQRPRRRDFDSLDGRSRIAVSGRVFATETVASPLTGREGVYVRFLIEEQRATSALQPVRGGAWHAVAFDEVAAPFWLCGEDGTRLAVDPTGADFVQAATQGALDREGRRFEEAVLAGGQAVTVLGALELRAGADDAAGERLYRDSDLRLTLASGVERLVIGSDEQLRRRFAARALGWWLTALVCAAGAYQAIGSCLHGGPGRSTAVNVRNVRRGDTRNAPAILRSLARPDGPIRR